MPADFMRVDACPRCRHNLPSDPAPDENRTGGPLVHVEKAKEPKP